MAKAIVKPGICNFETLIDATVDSMTYKAQIKISTTCERLQKLASELGEVDAMELLTQPIADTEVYQAASRARVHAACPVPCAIIKAIEIAAGLALPAAVHIELER